MLISVYLGLNMPKSNIFDCIKTTVSNYIGSSNSACVQHLIIIIEKNRTRST